MHTIRNARKSSLLTLAANTATIVVLLAASHPSLAQTATHTSAKTQKHADPTNAALPRSFDGKPSLEGNWTNASLTAMQRPAKYKDLVIPSDRVAAETNSHPQVVRQRTDDNQDKGTSYSGKDLQSGRGYNAFWIDPGMTFNKVKGEYRTSFIVDPANGQIPYKSGARSALARADGEGGDPRLSSFDGPESRPLAERCILASGSAGPPLQTYLYNNNYEIVQTQEYVGIRAEMLNYMRVIKINGKHAPTNVQPLHGDSIGHWEGNTLVAETTQFSPHHQNMMIPLSPNAKVIEKFTRVSKDQILYEFAVDDPSRYSQPWRGEMSLNATRDLVYEYGCHEGNYALSGILLGAREAEKRGGK
jgi:hypothetical protein